MGSGDTTITLVMGRVTALLLLLGSATSFSILPNSPGWTELMLHRGAQIERMQVSQERWDASTTHVMTCCMLPNFTRTGFAVIQMPKSIHQRLLEKLRSAPRRQEGPVDQISGDQADFVDIGGLGREIMSELQSMHEVWAGLPRGGLEPSNAYGLRLYKPGNTLTMHTDHTITHVISSILHVDRDVDEAWPIVIEGFDGKTHEVDLQPGEMLFYESAKCNHGRPRPMVGRWYTSLFVHYKPTQNWQYTVHDAIKKIESANQRGVSVPGGWGIQPQPIDDDLPSLRMKGTGMFEPECKNSWCNLAEVWPPVKQVHSDL